MCGCFACMYVCTRACLVPSERPEKGMGFPGTRVTDNYELSCRYWELNPAPLKEHPVSVPNY